MQMRPRHLRAAGDPASWRARKGHSRRGWAGAPEAGRAGTPAQLSGARVSPAQRGRLASFAAPSPNSPPRPSPLPAFLHHLPPRSSLKGVLGFLRFLMNPGWAARKMRARGVRRPAASPASPFSPSWAGAPRRRRGSRLPGRPGSAACPCPRRRRSRTTAGRHPPASAQTRTALRSPAPSTTPPSPFLAWVRIARRRVGLEQALGEGNCAGALASGPPPPARAAAARGPGPRVGTGRGALLADSSAPRALGRNPEHGCRAARFGGRLV